MGAQLPPVKSNFFGARANLANWIKTKSGSAQLTVLGDSTGNETTEWVYLSAQKLAARYPHLRIVYRLFSDATQSYGAKTIIAEGSGERYLTPDGSRQPFATSVRLGDYAAGDISFTAKVALTDWTPTVANHVIGRWGDATHRGFMFGIHTDAKIILWHSNDGVSANQRNTRSTVAPTVVDGADLHIRADLDVDNGAGQYAVSFYTSSDGDTWTQLGTTVLGTTGTIAGVYNPPSAAYYLGTGGSAGGGPALGKIYYVKVLEGGINGRNVLPTHPIDDFATVNSGDTGTVSVGQTLTIHNASVAGQGLTYHSDATRLAKTLLPSENSFVTINTTHNDVNNLIAGSESIAVWETLLSAITTLRTSASITAVLQNPEISPAGWYRNHNLQVAALRSYFGRKNVDVADFNQAILSTGAVATYTAADGVHPNAVGSAICAKEFCKPLV